MPAEEHSRYDQEEVTEEHSFDELAKGMAGGAISRGRMLKLIGAGLLGSISLGSWPRLLVHEGYVHPLLRQRRDVAVPGTGNPRDARVLWPLWPRWLLRGAETGRRSSSCSLRE